MNGSERVRTAIIGSGIAIPPNRVTNDQLALLMDTSDEWIRERTGVETRYYVDPGTGSAALGTEASCRALQDAGVTPEEIDLVIFATMTPDHYFPGCGPLLQRDLGLRPVPCLDIRQQCSGFIYGLEVADAHIRSGGARTVLLVGAEVHSGFMPWKSWDCLYEPSATAPDAEERDWNTKFRDRTVLFGDAGAAVVLRAVPEMEDRGLVDVILKTDGTGFRNLYVPGGGFSRRPYFDPDQFHRGDHIPVMEGRKVFRLATTRMTAVVRELLERNGLPLDRIAMVLMHQANLRINEAVQKTLGLPADRVYHNIQKYGNTTAATLPLLWHECRETGRIRDGDHICFVAFGAGLQWGAALLRA
jgi:3-oxoacyl-[acyl-carrier-protein] synthase-3